MKKIISGFTTLILFQLWFASCKQGPDKNDISTDSLTITRGEISFTKNCSGCHNFRQDGIGPKLGGITNEAPIDWIQQFIRDPKKIIESGDARAQKLFKKYHSIMPSFEGYAGEEIQAIIAFLHTHKGAGKREAELDSTALENPIPAPITVSNLVVGIKLVTQIPPSSDSGKLPLTRITKIGFQPNKEGSFILDLRGKLYHLQNNQPVVYMDMAKLKTHFIHEPGLATGFGSFAFHPEFAKNGLLYTTHTESPGSGKADFAYADSIKVTLQWVLTEWKTDQPNAPVFSGAGRELLRINFVTGIHGVQEIMFNPLSKKSDQDYGQLYIGIGDGGSVEEGYPFLAHSPAKIWGTIIRIDPAGRNSSNGKYGIPPQNPFAQHPEPNALGEIYAYGFRNPHRITWSRNGQMLVCNIGHSHIESLNLILPGHDYGWPIREGNFVLNPYADLTRVYPLAVDDSLYHITYPVAEYDHDEGKAISGGFEYQGTAIPQLKGKYLFGDIPSGRLFYVEMADIKQGKQATIKEWKVSIDGTEKTLHALCGADRVDLHFGRDIKGELYILTKADGKVYELITATDQPGTR